MSEGEEGPQGEGSSMSQGPEGAAAACLRGHRHGAPQISTVRRWGRKRGSNELAAATNNAQQMKNIQHAVKSKKGAKGQSTQTFTAIMQHTHERVGQKRGRYMEEEEVEVGGAKKGDVRHPDQNKYFTDEDEEQSDEHPEKKQLEEVEAGGGVARLLCLEEVSLDWYCDFIVWSRGLH